MHKLHALLGLLLFQMLGCGFDPATGIIEETPSQSAVIYGTDSIVEVDLETPNASVSVALTSQSVATEYLVGNSVATVSELYGRHPLSWIDQPAVAHCSGVLIKDDVVLTAAHCLRFAPCKETVFLFNFQSSKTEDVISRTCAEVIAQENAEDLDYALLRLSAPILGTSVRISNSSPKLKGKIYTLGYPLGAFKKKAEGQILSLDRNIVLSDLDVFAGNSGSPVFSSETHELLGILVGGESDFVPSEKNPDQLVLKVCGAADCLGEKIIPIQKVFKNL
ncbi:serine protease [Bdellovibrio bacteriovorus]|uniref:trypsin-like serine peptidase n=1 Tax=Bdellovibrio bacteriovorus TaxID=959 RepID=UPI0035A6C03D